MSKTEYTSQIHRLSYNLFLHRTLREATSLIQQEAHPSQQLPKLISYARIQILLGEDPSHTLQQAKTEAEKFGDSNQRATNYQTIGYAYLSAGNIDEAVAIGNSYLEGNVRDDFLKNLVLTAQRNTDTTRLRNLALHIVDEEKRVEAVLQVAHTEINRGIDATESLTCAKDITSTLQNFSQNKKVSNYLMIAQLEAAQHHPYQQTLDQVEEIAYTIYSKERRVEMLCRLAKTMARIGDDPEALLIEALEMAKAIPPSKAIDDSRSKALDQVADIYTNLGQFEKALPIIDEMNDEYPKWSAKADVVKKRIALAVEADNIPYAISLVRTLHSYDRNHGATIVLNELLEQNNTAAALNLVDDFDQVRDKLTALIKIAQKQIMLGHDYSQTIMLAKQQAEHIHIDSDRFSLTEFYKFLAVHNDMEGMFKLLEKQPSSYMQEDILRTVGKALAQHGNTSSAMEIADQLKAKRSFGHYWDICAEAAVAYLEKGDRVRAVQTMNSIGSEELKMETLARFADHDNKHTLSSLEISELTPDTVSKELANLKDPYVLEAIGFFEMAITIPADISPAGKIYILLGQAEQTGENQYVTQAKRILLSLYKKRRNPQMRIEQEHALKAFVQGIIHTQDYEIASNNMFGLISDLGMSFQEGNATSLRVIKGLIELDNPRGKTIATELFARTDLPEAYRTYIAQKLFAQRYWDPRLGEYLSKSATSVASQEEILTALITQFGLTPDLLSYTLLEKKGYLQSDTLSGRIKELQEAQHQFESKPRDELISLLLANEGLFQFFYVTHVGKHKYSIVNDYTQEKFRITLETIAGLSIHHGTLAEFQRILFNNDMSLESVQAVMADIIAGRPLVLNQQQRSFAIDVGYEDDAVYETLLQEQLTDVWKTQLHGILIAASLGISAENIAKSSELVTEVNRTNLRTNVMMQDISTVLSLDNPIDLPQIDIIGSRAKEKLLGKIIGNGQERERIKGLAPRMAIVEYLNSTLPQTGALSEWTENFLAIIESYDTIESAKKTAGKKYSGKQELEVTFLDKNTDFVRSIRFADAARCCFNSTNENVQARTYQYATRLNKDPLSFMLDIKWKDSNEVIGFTFGRIGIDPQTNRPVIMVNGIYSQIKTPHVVDRILGLIEQQMGTRLHAESIVIASKHGGTIHKPKRYARKKRKIRAMRALANKNGKPEEPLYDDIGTVANGEFTFNANDGFTKSLAA